MEGRLAHYGERMDLGTWADWFAGVATAGSVYYAVHTFARTALAADRAQADLVVLRFEVKILPVSQGLLGFALEGSLRITNRSSQPVFDVMVKVEDLHASKLDRITNFVGQASKIKWLTKPKPSTIWDFNRKAFANAVIVSDFKHSPTRSSEENLLGVTMDANSVAVSSVLLGEYAARKVVMYFTDARDQRWKWEYSKPHPERLKRSAHPDLITEKPRD